MVKFGKYIILFLCVIGCNIGKQDADKHAYQHKKNIEYANRYNIINLYCYTDYDWNDEHCIGSLNNVPIKFYCFETCKVDLDFKKAN